MPAPEAPREEALRRLRERAAALETSTARPVTPAHGHQAVGQAYTILGALVGGVIVGVALGAGVDFLMGTAPWGMIVGVLTGFVVSIYMAKLTADRLMAQAARENGPASPAPMLDDDEDEER